MRSTMGWTLAALLALPAALAAQPAGRPRGDAGFSRFARTVVEHLKQAGVERPRGMLVVMADSGNTAIRFGLAESNVPAELEDGIRTLVAQYLHARGSAAPVNASVRLERVPPPPEAAARTAVRVLEDDVAEEMPRLRNAHRVREILGAIARQHPDFGVRSHSEPAVLLMRVDRTGSVSQAHVLRPTGEMEIDRFLHALAYEARFVPARLDGEPVTVWVELPLRLVF
ncbi:MAG TPA: hypothetical protein VFQ45_08150 [Longimicrobium sp.]|nr:hypothetical protein [Longimicrobium sp.]